MKPENQVTKLLDDANAIADMIADERAPEPDPDYNNDPKKMAETSNELVQYLAPLIDKHIRSHGDHTMPLSGILDGLAVLLCGFARSIASNDKTYFEGTREIFEHNLDYYSDLYDNQPKKH